MADVRLFGRVRQLLQGVDGVQPGYDQQLPMSEQLEPLVAIASSPHEETVKLGRAFETHTTSAVAAVVAVPTVANLLSVWNGEADYARVLIIDRVWALMVVGTAVVGQASLIGCLGQTRVTQLTSASLAKNALNGNGGSDTRVVNSTTNLDAVTGVAANWRLLPGQTGGTKPGAAATPGVWINAEVNGRIMVPPGRLFAVHVLADVVGSTFVAGIEWHEKTIRLG